MAWSLSLGYMHGDHGSVRPRGQVPSKIAHLLASRDLAAVSSLFYILDIIY